MARNSRPVSCYLLMCVCLLQMAAPIRSGCPQPELLYPCSCHHSLFGTHVFCGGDSYINLENIFESLSTGMIGDKKHFNHLTVSNTAVNELPENVLRDVTFDEILIENALNLSNVNRNAFTETNWMTQTFIIKQCPKLKTSGEDLFYIISKMKNLKNVVIDNVNLTEIPSRAFRPINGYQRQLETILISGRSVRKIGSNCFRYLNALKNITLINTSIDTIPDNAFSFSRLSDNKLFVTLTNNSLLTGHAFSKNSLSNVWRPMQVSGIRASVLPEEVFGSFLNSHEHNSLEISGRRFDCHNCHNFWIRRNTELYSRISGIDCSTGYEFRHNNNFINCRH